VSAIGAFTFVLHSHLPYARLAGRWPHGEEWIHEAASETYIPLLETLYDLKEEGIPFKLTIGITPVLAEQLADALVLEHFDQFLDAKIAAAIKDMRYFEGQPLQPENAATPLIAGGVIDERKTGTEARVVSEARVAAAEEGQRQQGQSEPIVVPPGVSERISDKKVEEVGVTTYEPTGTADKHLRYLAEWYLNFYTRIKHAFAARFNRDIIGAFRRLQDEGYIEITTSAATHGYLPLLGRDSSLSAQLRSGVSSYKRLFGRAPTGIWLPECAYRPAYITAEGKIRPGIEYFLAENDLKVFFSETHAITGGLPVGVAAGDVIGPYGEIKRRYVIPATSTTPQRAATTYHPYYVSNSTAGLGAEDHSGVAVIGRNNRTGEQVWSADWGYPGDFDYREFHKKAGTSGLQYWRVTGAKTDLAHKDYYHPEWAMFKVEQHAEHFAHLVEDLLRDYNTKTGEYGLIASNYDTELFGHWWFEGVAWLGMVLRLLARSSAVELTTASQYVSEHPPTEVLNVPEGSWGAGGTHFTWDNGDTHWMWQPIHEAEVRMEGLAAEYTNPSEDERVVLNQAARELLLLQSSDWPFLVTTGQAREYAIQRYSQHLERFNKLVSSLDARTPNRSYAEECYELDKLFPDIDYCWFSMR
jgi:1,4-alpha-glucan branching enzyme